MVREARDRRCRCLQCCCFGRRPHICAPWSDAGPPGHPPPPNSAGLSAASRCCPQPPAQCWACQPSSPEWRTSSGASKVWRPWGGWQVQGRAVRVMPNPENAHSLPLACSAYEQFKAVVVGSRFQPRPPPPPLPSLPRRPADRLPQVLALPGAPQRLLGRVSGAEGAQEARTGTAKEACSMPARVGGWPRATARSPHPCPLPRSLWPLPPSAHLPLPPPPPPTTTTSLSFLMWAFGVRIRKLPGPAPVADRKMVYLVSSTLCALWLRLRPPPAASCTSDARGFSTPCGCWSIVLCWRSQP